MIEFAKLDGEEKDIIFTKISNKKIQEHILEKVFWVCFILDYLFNRCKWENALVFKGGTSLSKSFNLIERFSEDIDLILDWRLINYNSENLWAERSKTQQDKLNKNIVSDTSTFLQEIFIPSIKEDLQQELREDIRIELDKNDSDGCTVNVYYPNIYSNTYIKPVIRLEIGPLAEWMPSHDREITPYVTKEYPNLFKNPKTTVKTIDVERTFWEKLLYYIKLHLIQKMAKYLIDIQGIIMTFIV